MSADLPPDVTSWSVSDVSVWLKAVLQQKYPEHSFEDLSSNVLRHMIDGPVLLQLSMKEWKEAIPLLGPRKTLLVGVRGLQAQGGGRARAHDVVRATQTQLRVVKAMSAAPPPPPPPADYAHCTSSSFVRRVSAGPRVHAPRSALATHGTFTRALLRRASREESPRPAGAATAGVHLPYASAAASSPRLLVAEASPASRAPLPRPPSMEGPLPAPAAAGSQPCGAAGVPEPLRSPSHGRIQEEALDASGGNRVPSVRDFVRVKRPDLVKESVVLVPSRSLDDLTEGADMPLFSRSAFCNLPVVDCGFVPLGFEQLPWHARAWFNLRHTCCKGLFFVDTIFHMLRLKDLLFVACIVVLTWQCFLHRWTLGISATLLLNILLFPLAFAVNAAYQRRNGALHHFGTFKTATLYLYLQHRCWQLEPDLPMDFLDCSRGAIRAAFDAARAYLTSNSQGEKQMQLVVFYNTMADIMVMNDVLRLSGLPAPLIASAMGHLKTAHEAFEHLRQFSDYRTPSGIRAFISVCKYSIPILLTPYFAHLGWQGETYVHAILAIISGGLCTFPFLLLNNLQLSLENPFCQSDGTSFDPDDIKLDELYLETYIKEDADASNTRHVRDIQRRMSRASEAASSKDTDVVGVLDAPQPPSKVPLCGGDPDAPRSSSREEPRHPPIAGVPSWE